MTNQDNRTARQTRGVRLTVLALAVVITIIVAGFVHRIQMPRILTEEEMKINGLYLLQPPRNFGELNLVDQRGAAFNNVSLQGKWSLVFFGFTYCPDVCPTCLLYTSDAADE